MFSFRNKKITLSRPKADNGKDTMNLISSEARHNTTTPNISDPAPALAIP